MTIIEQKKKLRKQMHIARTKFNNQEKKEYDQRICQSIWAIILKHNFRKVHCYIPMGTEIDIIPLIEKMLSDNIQVITPKTLPDRKLQNLILKSLNELEEGVFGTRHPTNTEEYNGQYDLIIVPGLAFNNSNYRLGYGGGYYDNFLVKFPGVYKLGICYPFQKINPIPLESHDIQLDCVLSL